MANLAYTQYVIEGTRKDLSKLDHIFMDILKLGRENGWEDRFTLFRLIRTINPYAEGEMRGDWDNYEFVDEPNKVKKIYFDTETAWCRNLLLEETIKKLLPKVKIYYYVDTDEGFESNDKKQKYFNSKYRIDYSLKEDEDIETFSTLEVFLAKFNLLMNTDCKTFEEAEDFANGYEDEEYYINVYK